MSIENNVSVSLSSDKKSTILGRCDELDAQLDFLLALNPTQRLRRLKAGQYTEAFLSEALTLAQQHPEITPKGLSVEEMQKDADTRAFLRTVRSRLLTTLQRLDDTIAVCGTEMFQASLLVYQGAKTYGQGLGIESQVAELGKRFKKAKTTADTEEREEVETA